MTNPTTPRDSATNPPRARRPGRVDFEALAVCTPFSAGEWSDAARHLAESLDPEYEDRAWQTVTELVRVTAGGTRPTVAAAMVVRAVAVFEL